jgi:hypothetical protein
MTWVTVQSHDIGDTFPGIYALEKTFSVGSASAICSCGQEQERVIRVAVWSFWDQSQERLQVVGALSGRGSQSFGGCFASAAPPKENASFCVANAVAQSATGASSLGSKKVATIAATSFSRAEAASGGEHVGALACGVAFGEEAAAPGAARTAPAVEGSTRANRLQPSVDDRLQRLVSHGRWAALRTAHRARFVQSVCTGGDALAQPKRCRCAPSSCASFSSLRSAQSDSGGQWLALWWQRRSGVIALECVVAALGHYGGLCPACSSPRQRRARTNASGAQSGCSHSARAQHSGAEATHPSLDQLLQSSASSRSFGPARPCADLLAEQSTHAAAVAKRELSVHVAEQARAQSRTHQMARSRAFYRASLCRRSGRAERDGRGHPRSVSRSPSHWLALRARSSRNATGYKHASSVRQTARSPLQLNRVAWERAPEQTAALPSSYLASLFRRAPSHPRAKVLPMS